MPEGCRAILLRKKILGSFPIPAIPFHMTRGEVKKIYKSLGLNRSTKSARNRQIVEKRSVYRIIGGDIPEHPPLRVDDLQYWEIRNAVTLRLLQKAARHLFSTAPEIILKSLQNRIEMETYHQIARQQQTAAILEENYLKTEKRHLTKEELCQFAAATETESVSPSSYSDYRSYLLKDLLSKISSSRTSGSECLQTAWAAVVGADKATQSWLDRIDKATGTGFFRCLNSALAHELQRSPEICRKLSAELKQPVRRLRSC